MSRQKLEKMPNPMEWLSWLYGRFFTNHTTWSYLLVCSLAAFLAFLVWTKAIDNYRAQHRPETPASNSVPPQPAKTGNASTSAPNSPAVTGNGNTVVYGDSGKGDEKNRKPPH